MRGSIDTVGFYRGRKRMAGEKKPKDPNLRVREGANIAIGIEIPFT